MKTLFCVVLFSAVTSASYAGCVSLDYQEMKEMDLSALKKEWCKAETTAGNTLEETIGKSGVAHDLGLKTVNECFAQRDRIQRVLVQRGVKAETKQETQTLVDSCSTMM